MTSCINSMARQEASGPGTDGAGDLGIFRKLIRSEFTLTQIPAHTFVLEQHHKISQVGYICSGELHLMGTGPNGGTRRKGRMTKGDFFGLEMFFDQGLALYDALALNALDCYVIESDRLLTLMSQIPELKSCMENRLMDVMRRFVQMPATAEDVCGPAENPGRTVKIEKAAVHIQTRYMDQITLDDMAERTGLSRFYFSRMFKREIGHSFKAYLNINRINASKRLLGLPEMNVSQVCYSVGFNDVSYFARIFKRYEGRSPSDFRKEALTAG